MSLAHADPTRVGIDEIIEAIYSAAVDLSEWPFALQKIADYFADPGANMCWRREDGSIGILNSPGKERLGSSAWAQHWWQHDIRAQRAWKSNLLIPHHAITDRHVVSDEERATHPIYTEFLRSYGLGWFAGVRIVPDPALSVNIIVVRRDHRPPYSDSELETLGRLSRHVENSLRLSIRRINAEANSIGLGQALGHIGVGVFILDQKGEVVFDNPESRGLLGDGIHLARKRLIADCPSEHAELEAAIDLAIDEGTNPAELPRPFPISRQSKRPLAVYVLPLQAGQGPVEDFLVHGRAIVLVIGSETNTPPDAALVRDLLGLTLGEARVAALVGCGLAPRDAAAQLGIAEETARNVLKRVFSKLGVSRQSELAALMTKLVLR